MDDTFNPKLDSGKIYSRDDFIFRLEAISALNSSDTHLVSLLEKLITWAEAHPENTVISFEERGGIIYPLATVCTQLPILEYYSNQPGKDLLH